MGKCKLGVISQEQLKTQVKLLVSAKVLIESHICHVDSHNNG